MKLKLTTARLLSSIALLTAIGIAIGISIVAATPAASSGSCAEAKHRHRYADLRLALVEIQERDECGFRFKDLELPVSDRVEFSEDFAANRVDVNDPEQSIAIAKSELRSGLHCVIAYCRACRRVLSLKTWTKQGGARP